MFKCPVCSYRLLEISDGIEDLGSMHWKLLGCHIFAWAIEYFCIFKGVNITGKVQYMCDILAFSPDLCIKHMRCSYAVRVNVVFVGYITMLI